MVQLRARTVKRARPRSSTRGEARVLADEYPATAGFLELQRETGELVPPGYARCPTCRRVRRRRNDGLPFAHDNCTGSPPVCTGTPGMTLCEHGNYPNERRGCGCPKRGYSYDGQL